MKGHAAMTALSLAVLIGSPSSAAVTTWDEVVERYGRVRDYTALYEKEERAISNGERQTIRLAFRKPMDVRLDWLNEDGKVDQSAVYRQGHNNGKVVARRSGVLGKLAGTVTLDPRDRLAMQDSRHPITEVGIGHVIDRVSEGIRRGHLTPGPVRDVRVDGKEADQFTFEAASGGALGVDGARRAIVWIDRETTLPMRVEILAADGTVLERHHFKELRTNVGLTDSTFTI
jgi:outer membrane lipoprotein-sorting protein